MLGYGQARTDLTIDDKSVVPVAGFVGIAAVLGITERGELATPVLVRSWTEYTRHFGGLVTYSLFPLYCKRALDGGSPLLVSRVAHYTDIANSATAVGGKATITLDDATNSVVVTAKNIGTWGNGISITVANAANLVASEVDVTVSLAGYPELDITVRNVPNDPDATALAKLNAQLKLVQFATPSGTLPVQTVTALVGGTEDYTGVIAADYIGHATALLGIHAFDSDNTAVRICAMENYDNTVEIALKAYAELRGNITPVLRTPSNISGSVAIEFRTKTGAYVGGQVIDSHRMRLVYGDHKVINPLTGLSIDIHVIGDVLGLMAKKDQDYAAWISAAGSTRGKINNTLGVVYNLGTAARKAEADLVDFHGINVVIDHASFGTVYWGNSTMQIASTLLKHANVDDLLVYLNRELVVPIQTALFDPNDIETWKGVYRRVSALMETVKADRGVFDYRYEGDQDIDSIEEAQINSPENIAQGIYKFILHVQPIPALKYMGIGVSVTTTGISLEIV